VVQVGKPAKYLGVGDPTRRSAGEAGIAFLGDAVISAQRTKTKDYWFEKRGVFRSGWKSIKLPAGEPIFEVEWSGREIELFYEADDNPPPPPPPPDDDNDDDDTKKYILYLLLLILIIAAFKGAEDE
jgi:hypothetical protein